MIYLDTSVAIAQLLAEDRVPSEELWRESLVASRLIEYEMWTRLHARGLGKSHGIAARQVLDRVAMLELIPIGQRRKPAIAQEAWASRPPRTVSDSSYCRL